MPLSSGWSAAFLPLPVPLPSLLHRLRETKKKKKKKYLVAQKINILYNNKNEEEEEEAAAKKGKQESVGSSLWPRGVWGV